MIKKARKQLPTDTVTEPIIVILALLKWFAPQQFFGDLSVTPMIAKDETGR
jgi:hypothetical protein